VTAVQPFLAQRSASAAHSPRPPAIQLPPWTKYTVGRRPAAVDSRLIVTAWLGLGPYLSTVEITRPPRGTGQGLRPDAGADLVLGAGFGRAAGFVCAGGVLCAAGALPAAGLTLARGAVAAGTGSGR
jgi:hypothetical protein